LVLIPLTLKKHGLTYTTLSRIWIKEKNIFVKSFFQHEIFYVDLIVHIKMSRLKTIQPRSLILKFKNLHNSHVIILSLNTTYLHQQYEDINHDHNLQMSHILYFYRNNNTPCINRCAKIYKFIKVLIYCNPWWLWVKHDTWHTHGPWKKWKNTNSSHKVPTFLE